MSEITIMQTPKGQRCSNKCDLYCTRLNSEPYCKMGWEIERDGGFISPDPDKCPGPGTYVLAELEEWEKINEELKASKALDNLATALGVDEEYESTIRATISFLENKGHDVTCQKDRKDIPEMEPTECTCGLDLILFELEKSLRSNQKEE